MKVKELIEFNYKSVCNNLVTTYYLEIQIIIHVYF